MKKKSQNFRKRRIRMFLLCITLLLLVAIPSQVFALTFFGTPQTLDNAGWVGLYTSLAVVDGNPAISYLDYAKTDLKFIRAKDASGTYWGTPQILDSAGQVGEFTSLAVVGGY
ncbi:MAG: hypothetical protein JEZ00_22105, partial [Anaerolineaceae bacterium]|nr:hypothetical protein [Anaerolineaceae bacterium]